MSDASATPGAEADGRPVKWETSAFSTSGASAWPVNIRLHLPPEAILALPDVKAKLYHLSSHSENQCKTWSGK